MAATKKDLKGNAYSAECPARLVLDQIGDKWTVLVLGVLAKQPTRFNELKRRLEGVSQKMLGQTLKKLERNGLVTRQVFPTVPVTVEYSITPLGQTLAVKVDALRGWAEEHIGEVVRAQQSFDART
ncbi:helix-turn-helix transcriptional regulator [Archangium violaceum]|uniref:winged helix-turn-helix transcriptional regulator n=1 Tax=Archangium violaceum TaxID=83451 RepID=UPI002B2AB39B|nr:helix-turn-helix transcriptional regulator [Archangium violaceum]